MMDDYTGRAVIRNNVSREELLAQLAEECMELGHAAMKLRRVISGTNPTPVTADDAEDSVREEIADVLVVVNLLEAWNLVETTDMEIDHMMEMKQARWARRLRKAGMTMALRMSEEEFEAWKRSHVETASVIHPKPRRAEMKYGNRRVEINGKRFDSQHEADVYEGLMLRRRAGELWLVLRQVPFDLPGGIRYFADFVTVDYRGNVEVIDAKSEPTKKNRVYINKKKQIKEIWDVEIKEM